jgi:hypothetical protein
MSYSSAFFALISLKTSILGGKVNSIWLLTADRLEKL